MWSFTVKPGLVQKTWVDCRPTIFLYAWCEVLYIIWCSGFVEVIMIDNDFKSKADWKSPEFKLISKNEREDGNPVI